MAYDWASIGSTINSQNYFGNLWDWMKNREIIQGLRERTQPLVSEEELVRIEPVMATNTVTAPGARQVPSSPIYTQEQLRKLGSNKAAPKAPETEEQRRERLARRYKTAGALIESGAEGMREKELSPNLPSPSAPAGTSELKPMPKLPTIQALISGKPSITSRLFGGY